MALNALVGSLQPSRDLLRGPLHLDLRGHDVSQSAILDQLAALGAMGPYASGLVGKRRSLALPTAGALDLTANS